MSKADRISRISVSSLRKAGPVSTVGAESSLSVDHLHHQQQESPDTFSATLPSSQPESSPELASLDTMLLVLDELGNNPEMEEKILAIQRKLLRYYNVDYRSIYRLLRPTVEAHLPKIHLPKNAFSIYTSVVTALGDIREHFKLATRLKATQKVLESLSAEIGAIKNTKLSRAWEAFLEEQKTYLGMRTIVVALKGLTAARSVCLDILDQVKIAAEKNPGISVSQKAAEKTVRTGFSAISKLSWATNVLLFIGSAANAIRKCVQLRQQSIILRQGKAYAEVAQKGVREEFSKYLSRLRREQTDAMSLADEDSPLIPSEAKLEEICTSEPAFQAECRRLAVFCADDTWITLQSNLKKVGRSTTPAQYIRNQLVHNMKETAMAASTRNGLRVMVQVQVRGKERFVRFIRKLTVVDLVTAVLYAARVIILVLAAAHVIGTAGFMAAFAPYSLIALTVIALLVSAASMLHNFYYTYNKDVRFAARNIQAWGRYWKVWTLNKSRKVAQAARTALRRLFRGYLEKQTEQIRVLKGPQTKEVTRLERLEQADNAMKQAEAQAAEAVAALDRQKYHDCLNADWGGYLDADGDLTDLVRETWVQEGMKRPLAEIEKELKALSSAEQKEKFRKLDRKVGLGALMSAIEDQFELNQDVDFQNLHRGETEANLKEIKKQIQAMPAEERSNLYKEYGIKERPSIRSLAESLTKLTDLNLIDKELRFILGLFPVQIRPKGYDASEQILSTEKQLRAAFSTLTLEI